LGGGKASKSRARARQHSLRRARLRELVDEAIVDAYGESEQVGGFYTAIEEHLAVPFETTVLGMTVIVRGVDLSERDEIVAICARGRYRQAIPILDLVLPSPAPEGAEWIEAYRFWAAGC
jgi:hypothetical protein